MAEVCVSRNMSIAGGLLGIEPWTLPRIVLDQTFVSTGDGAYGQQTTLPGKLMIDSGILTWTNPSPLDARLLVRVQRGRQQWQVSNPNAVQVRDRYTYAIDDDPRVPDTSSVYTGQSGGSIDVGVQVNGTPFLGVYWEWQDPTLTEDWIPGIPPGAQFRMWYRCYLWTPPPWSNNANSNNPQHSAAVHDTRIQLIAFPTQDTEVVG